MTTDEQSLKMQKIAQKIIDKIPQKENFGFVITILMIISITLTLIRIIQECNKDKTTAFSAQEKYEYYGSEIHSLSMKKTWFTKMMTKKIIRKEIGKDNYKTYGIDIMNAIFETGEQLTSDEIITLVEAAHV